MLQLPMGTDGLSQTQRGGRGPGPCMITLVHKKQDSLIGPLIHAFMQLIVVDGLLCARFVQVAGIQRQTRER